MATVTIPYNNAAIDWAIDNCPSYITNTLAPTTFPADRSIDIAKIRVMFYFSQDKDATLFALRWCQNE